MKAGSSPAVVGWVVNALRGRNALVRPADRVVAAAMLALLVLALAVVPALAISLGEDAYAASRREAAERATSEHVVEATVLAVPRSGGDPRGGTSDRLARVEWEDVDGRPRVERAEIPESARAGSHVSVWIDRSGRVAEPPPTELESRFGAFGVSLSTLVLGVLCGVGLGKGVRKVADLRSARAWESEWEVVEPHWTRPGNG
jgi:hypothetical protein